MFLQRLIHCCLNVHLSITNIPSLNLQSEKGKIFPEQFRKYSTLLDHPREVTVGLKTVHIIMEVSNG